MANLLSIFARKPQGLGIEVAADRLNIVRLRKQGQVIKLVTFITTPMPEGIIQEGRIVDPVGLAELIQGTLTSANLTKVRRVATSIPGRDAVTRLIPVPAEVDEQELRDVVLNQEAGLFLPFPREDADVDYQKLGLFIDEDGIEKVQVLLVATRREVTDSYLNTFERAGLEVDVLETSSLSLIRTVRTQLRHFTSQEAVAIVNIESESTEICIVLDGVPQFSRTVSIGTYQVQAALARAMNLPPSPNSDILQSLTIPLGTPGEPAPRPASPGTSAAMRVLGELADELRRSIDFYLNQVENREVAQVMLAGPGASISLVDEFFGQRLSLPVVPLDPIANLAIETTESIPPAQRVTLGVVLGLGLREVS